MGRYSGLTVYRILGLYWSCIGKMEATRVYWGYIGIIVFQGLMLRVGVLEV